MNREDLSSIIKLTKNLHSTAPVEWLPSDEGSLSKSQSIIYNALVKNTRGYIVKIANQINGCYEQGWFDACAVMIRRLLETLIIEIFEYHKIESKIKKGEDYFYLRDLINITLAERAWTLSRNARNALPKLKDIGDKSAHSRRFNAVRQDIDELKSELRTIVQELLSIAHLK